MLLTAIRLWRWERKRAFSRDMDCIIFEIQIRDIKANAFRDTDAGTKQQGDYGEIPETVEPIPPGNRIVNIFTFYQIHILFINAVQKNCDLIRLQIRDDMIRCFFLA